MRDFEVSKERKKQYIRNWLYSLPEYRKRNWLVNCLYAASIALFVFYASVPAFVFLLGECNVAAIGAGFEVGFVVAVIPFAFAWAISVKAKRNCGSPYTKREEESSKVYEDGVECSYHNTDSRYVRSRDVYRIPVENINAVRFDEEYHIVTIIGEGEFLSYDDFPSKRLNHQNSQRRFYSNSPYSILMAFDKEKEAVILLKNRAKNQEN